MTINDGCSNAISVILNENIILFLVMTSTLKKDSTFDQTVLRAKLLILQTQSEEERTTVLSVLTLFKKLQWKQTNILQN